MRFGWAESDSVDAKDDADDYDVDFTCRAASLDLLNAGRQTNYRGLAADDDLLVGNKTASHINLLFPLLHTGHEEDRERGEGGFGRERFAAKNRIVGAGSRRQGGHHSEGEVSTKHCFNLSSFWRGICKAPRADLEPLAQIGARSGFCILLPD